ncbi:hypothetical protein QP028_04690 [Corynebacterium suedekumii]|nr:hypothetical protein QP028_04690 [Corynebacterium suedekumii]
MKDDIFAKGDVLVRELAATGEFDGMTELAEAFPVSIVMDLIGIQGEIREKMLPWGEAALQHARAPQRARHLRPPARR